MNNQLANAILAFLLRAHGRAVNLTNAEVQVLALQDVRIEPLTTGDGIRVRLLADDIQLRARLAWQDVQAARTNLRAVPPHMRGTAQQQAELASSVYGKELVQLAARGAEAMAEHLANRNVPVTEAELDEVYNVDRPT